MRPKFLYATNCVDSRDGPAINAMTDRAREITYATVLRHVGRAQLAEVFPNYDWGPGTPDRFKGGPKLSTDWAVSFHRSRWRGVPCVYVRWSAIEFIFTERENR